MKELPRYQLPQCGHNRGFDGAFARPKVPEPSSARGCGHVKYGRADNPTSLLYWCSSGGISATDCDEPNGKHGRNLTRACHCLRSRSPGTPSGEGLSATKEAGVPKLGCRELEAEQRYDGFSFVAPFEPVRAPTYELCRAAMAPPANSYRPCQYQIAEGTFRVFLTRLEALREVVGGSIGFAAFDLDLIVASVIRALDNLHSWSGAPVDFVYRGFDSRIQLDASGKPVPSIAQLCAQRHLDIDVPDHRGVELLVLAGRGERDDGRLLVGGLETSHHCEVPGWVARELAGRGESLQDAWWMSWIQLFDNPQFPWEPYETDATCLAGVVLHEAMHTLGFRHIGDCPSTPQDIGNTHSVLRSGSGNALGLSAIDVLFLRNEFGIDPGQVRVQLLGQNDPLLLPANIPEAVSPVAITGHGSRSCAIAFNSPVAAGSVGSQTVVVTGIGSRETSVLTPFPDATNHFGAPGIVAATPNAREERDGTFVSEPILVASIAGDPNRNSPIEIAVQTTHQNRWARSTIGVRVGTSLVTCAFDPLPRRYLVCTPSSGGSWLTYANTYDGLVIRAAAWDTVGLASIGRGTNAFGTPALAFRDWPDGTTGPAGLAVWTTWQFTSLYWGFIYRLRDDPERPGGYGFESPHRPEVRDAFPQGPQRFVVANDNAVLPRIWATCSPRLTYTGEEGREYVLALSPISVAAEVLEPAEIDVYPPPILGTRQQPIRFFTFSMQTFRWTEELAWRIFPDNPLHSRLYKPVDLAALRGDGGHQVMTGYAFSSERL